MGYKVELYLSCKKLKDLDLLSKSDPKVRIYLKQGKDTQYKMIGQTEVVKNNLNPEFKTAIEMFYQFEMHQYLKFEVIDYDSEHSFDMIGSVETTLGAVVGSKDFTYQSDLHKDTSKAKRGEIIVRVAPMQESNIDVSMRISVRNLQMNTVCCCGTLVPFLEVCKALPSAQGPQYFPVLKSTATQNQNPNTSFQAFKAKA